MNERRPWTPDDIAKLKSMARRFPSARIARELRRGLPATVRAARMATVAVGLPTLFCLERGNLLMLAMPLMLYGIVQPKTGLRAPLALALAINLKPYLVVFALPLMLGPRGLAAAVRVVVACALVYLASVVFVGDGLPWDILSNIRGFTGDGLVNYWEKFYFSSSFGPFIRILESELPIDMYLDGSTAELFLRLMKTLMALSAAVTAAAFIAALTLPAERRPLLQLSLSNKARLVSLVWGSGVRVPSAPPL